MAALQDDVSAATAWVAEGQGSVPQMDNPEANAMIGIADGFTALVSGEFDRACARLEDAVGAADEPSLQVAMVLLGWGLEFRGERGELSSGRRKRLPSRNRMVNRCIENMRCGRWELAGGGMVSPTAPSSS